MPEPTKGKLPKAYLRLDPNLDQAHPDPGAMVRLLCAANRQPHRGRFKSRDLLDAVLGKAIAKGCIDRRDVVEQDDGRYYVPGWDEWQEGDWTVGERQRRIRDRRNAGNVTESHPQRDTTVTASPPPALPTPMAARQQGSKAARLPAGDDAHAVMLLVERLTTWGFDYRTGHKVHDTLVKDVETHGVDKVVQEYEAFRVANPGPMDPPQLVFGVHNALHPFVPSKAPAKGKGFNPTSDEAWDAFGGKDVA